nr:unnamed protein product [Spirometra erinaceieuropaei]
MRTSLTTINCDVFKQTDRNKQRFPLLVTQEEIPAVIPSLVENLETDIQCLATEDSLDRLLERTFKSGAETLHFSDLLPPSVSRKLAAKALHHLLCLLKKRKIRVSQSTPFGPIIVSSRT